MKWATSSQGLQLSPPRSPVLLFTSDLGLRKEGHCRGLPPSPNPRPLLLSPCWAVKGVRTDSPSTQEGWRGREGLQSYLKLSGIVDKLWEVRKRQKSQIAWKFPTWCLGGWRCPSQRECGSDMWGHRHVQSAQAKRSHPEVPQRTLPRKSPNHPDQWGSQQGMDGGAILRCTDPEDRPMYSDLGLVLVKVFPWGFPGVPWTELKTFHNSQAFQPASYPLAF